MARHSEDELRDKKTQTRIRASAYVSGTLKTRFIDDVLKEGVSESKHLLHIMRYYYDNHPSPNKF